MAYKTKMHTEDKITTQTDVKPKEEILEEDVFIHLNK